MAIVGLTNGGGGGSGAWAMVLVNYPSDSTLTATNVSGKKDISATQRLYYVKKPSGDATTQECTFTATNGTKSKAQTVSNITIGTSSILTLMYSIDIFNTTNGLITSEIGDLTTEMTGPSSTGHRIAFNAEGTPPTYLAFRYDQSWGGSGSEFYGSHANFIDLTDFNTLYINITNQYNRSGSSAVTLQIVNQSGTVVTSLVCSTGLKTIDISSITGNYKLKFVASCSDGSSNNGTWNYIFINNMYIE